VNTPALTPASVNRVNSHNGSAYDSTINIVVVIIIIIIIIDRPVLDLPIPEGWKAELTTYNVGDRLHTEMVYPPVGGHPSK